MGPKRKLFVFFNFAHGAFSRLEESSRLRGKQIESVGPSVCQRRHPSPREYLGQGLHKHWSSSDTL